jgi:hypothetical protein
MLTAAEEKGRKKKNVVARSEYSSMLALRISGSAVLSCTKI